MKSKLLSGKKLTNALDSVVRDILHKMFPEGVCFVSQKKYGWFHPKNNPRGCQVGHYISRKVYPLRWDLNNVYPQGSAENYEHQFNTLPFTMRIIEVYGVERFNYLQSRYKMYHNSGNKLTTANKRELLASLKKLLDNTPSV